MFVLSFAAYYMAAQFCDTCHGFVSTSPMSHLQGWLHVERVLKGLKLCQCEQEFSEIWCVASMVYIG